MAWGWRYESADGTVLRDEALPEEAFTSRSDAESWLGESWRKLRENGAERVSLLYEGAPVYTMGLNEEM